MLRRIRSKNTMRRRYTQWEETHHVNGSCDFSSPPYGTRDHLLAFLVHGSPKLRLLPLERITPPQASRSSCKSTSSYLLSLPAHRVALVLKLAIEIISPWNCFAIIMAPIPGNEPFLSPLHHGIYAIDPRLCRSNKQMRTRGLQCVCQGAPNDQQNARNSLIGKRKAKKVAMN